MVRFGVAPADQPPKEGRVASRRPARLRVEGLQVPRAELVSPDGADGRLDRPLMYPRSVRRVAPSIPAVRSHAGRRDRGLRGALRVAARPQTRHLALGHRWAACRVPWTVPTRHRALSGEHPDLERTAALADAAAPPSGCVVAGSYGQSPGRRPWTSSENDQRGAI